MAQKLRSTRLVVLYATALLATIPAASAQLLPDVVGGVRDTARELDRQIEEKVEDQLETTLGSVLDDTRILDGIGEIVPSSRIGNTLSQTLDSAGQLAGAIPGIVRLPEAVRPSRPVDLDTFDGDLVVRNEWVVLVPASRAADVEALNLDVVERTDLSGADETLFIVSLTATASTAAAIESQLASLGAEPFDRNHVFRGASEREDGPSSSSPQGDATVPSAAPGNLRIGLIDTDVDETHPALSGVSLYEADFVSMGELRPQTHGTGVASILARQSRANAPELLAASAFFLSDDGTTGATTASLIEAIDWLDANGAGVINISLTGPPNRALEAVIASRQQQGTIFVAAVGNEGPASGPLYPAAYDGVVGVTAVDKAGKIYRWANRGPFVDVAAMGVDVMVAKPGGGEARDSGTSFASPIITAFLGGWTDGKRTAPGLTDGLIRASAKSETGTRDDTYGYGILSPTN